MTATQTTLETLRIALTLSRQDVESFGGKADWPMSKVTRVERGTGSTTREEQDALKALMIELAAAKVAAINEALKATKAFKSSIEVKTEKAEKAADTTTKKDVALAAVK